MLHLSGQHSTQERKTYPKIQIVGTRRPAMVVVSCVTHDTDTPKAHPHNLVSPASVRQYGVWPELTVRCFRWGRRAARKECAPCLSTMKT